MRKAEQLIEEYLSEDIVDDASRMYQGRLVMTINNDRTYEFMDKARTQLFFRKIIDLGDAFKFKYVPRYNEYPKDYQVVVTQKDRW